MTIRVENLSFEYHCPCRALDDPGLRALMDDGATASVWMGEMCVVPDIVGWDRLREKLVANASTLLR